MQVLLHVCCAPCLIHPLEKIRGKGHKISGLFYNPNIHPVLEYKNRKEALEQIKEALAVDIIYPEHNPSEFMQAIGERSERPERCLSYWALRLKKTARTARENGFDSFSSTLLVSPYQDQEALKQIGNDISKSEDINFYYEDFRPGFREAHERARAMGIYCQKYCGCVYSEAERCKKSLKH